MLHMGRIINGLAFNGNGKFITVPVDIFAKPIIAI